MRDSEALDALRDVILDPATPTLVLAIDVPMRAAMLGLSWSVLRSLFDERRALLALRPQHARSRARRRR